MRAAIQGVLREAVIAAFLTGLMILLFLGSWRSTIMVCISIPLSILTSLAVLYLLNETINVMTLGGMALAVGILVDDATVEIENIHRNLAQGKPIVQAILDGAMQIATPAFVSTLCICIVFVPVVFLTGAARYLFTPLALAVVIAMMASYLLSRTLIPTMVRYLLAAEAGREHAHPAASPAHSNDWFEKLREAYRRTARLRSGASQIRGRRLSSFSAPHVSALTPMLGEDFFPQVDAGQIRLHVRAPAGTRIEETERYFAQVENTIRRVIPPAELTDILDDIGLPYSGFNIAMSDTATIGPFDGEILVSLRPGEHASTWNYIRELRARLNREYSRPDLLLPARRHRRPDSQFRIARAHRRPGGRPAHQRTKPITLWRGKSNAASPRIPGAVDVHTHQVVDVPELLFNVDRTRASQMGLSQQSVANSLLISLSSSTQIAPNYWIDPRNGVDYPVSVMTPQFRVDSTSELLRTPIRGGADRPAVDRQRGPAAARRHRRPWSITTTCSRSTTSTPTCRIATSARSRPTWTASSPDFSPSCPRAASSKRAARSPPCAARSRG